MCTSTENGSRFNRPPNSDVQTLDYAFDFFLAAQRPFIIADNFFRVAVLIGLRAVAYGDGGWWTTQCPAKGSRPAFWRSRGPQECRPLQSMRCGSSG